MAEDAPHAGLAQTHIHKFQRAVCLTEAEIFVRTAVIAHFAGKGNDIGTVHTYPGNLINPFFPVQLPGLREGADAAVVGVGRDAVVGDAHRHPDSAFPAGAFPDEIHHPGLFLIADREGFSALEVAVLIGQPSHLQDGVPGRCTALQSQLHQVVVAQDAFGVHQFFPASEGGFQDGELVLVHIAHHTIGIGDLVYVATHLSPVPEMADSNLLAGLMGSRGRACKPAGMAESVAVIGADDRTVGRCLLSHNHVGAGLGRQSPASEESQQDYDRYLSHNKMITSSGRAGCTRR